MMPQSFLGAFEQSRLKAIGSRQAGVGLLQERSNAGFHLARGLICEGKRENLVGMCDTAQEFYESSHKKHGLSGAGRGLHVMALGHVQSQLSRLMVWGQVR
jgi:hypothetical protein